MTLWNAPSVNPATVTDLDVAAILDEHGITAQPVDGGFFCPGVTYSGRDVFPCVAVGVLPTGEAAALGYLPVILRGARTWEFAILTEHDWDRHNWHLADARPTPAWTA